MNTRAAEKINLHKMLDKIPADRMEAVRSYLDALVGKTPPPASKTSLWGIWQGTEFEKRDTGSLAEGSARTPEGNGHRDLIQKTPMNDLLDTVAVIRYFLKHKNIGKAVSEIFAHPDETTFYISTSA
jgi:hypothetical protein